MSIISYLRMLQIPSLSRVFIMQGYRIETPPAIALRCFSSILIFRITAGFVIRTNDLKCASKPIH